MPLILGISVNVDHCLCQHVSSVCLFDGSDPVEPKDNDNRPSDPYRIVVVDGL